MSDQLLLYDLVHSAVKLHEQGLHLTMVTRRSGVSKTVGQRRVKILTEPAKSREYLLSAKIPCRGQGTHQLVGP